MTHTKHDASLVRVLLGPAPVRSVLLSLAHLVVADTRDLFAKGLPVASIFCSPLPKRREAEGSVPTRKQIWKAREQLACEHQIAHQFQRQQELSRSQDRVRRRSSFGSTLSRLEQGGNALYFSAGRHLMLLFFPAHVDPFLGRPAASQRGYR